MSGLSATEVIFISLNHSTTLMGKLWLIVMAFLRVLLLLVAGYPLYQDEQERFVCNTIQPGCANVCYDLFSPVSLFRFWLVQLITLCLPYVIFNIYVVHKVLAALANSAGAPGRAEARPARETRPELFGKSSANKVPPQGESWRTQCFTGAYLLHLLFRTLLEAGFGVAHYYLFGFQIPTRFLCQQPPCTTQVDCYISRPTEKTVMLNFMMAVGALSLLLNVLDIVCAIKRSVRQKRKRKLMAEKIYEEYQYYLSPSVDNQGADTNGHLTPQDLATEAARAGSFRKRGASKDPSSLGQGHSSYPGAPGSLTPAPHRSNTNGNNDYSEVQEDAPEADGSEVGLCPPEPLGTPRSIRVSKRSRLKPPPPPRRDLGVPPPRPVGTFGDIFPAAGAVYTRKVGPYTLVELTGGPEPQSNDESQDKKSAWV